MPQAFVDPAIRGCLRSQRVNAASLPYTVLLLLVELAIGSLAVTVLFDARRMVTRGYVKMGAVLVLSCAILAV